MVNQKLLFQISGSVLSKVVRLAREMKLEISRDFAYRAKFSAFKAALEARDLSEISRLVNEMIVIPKYCTPENIERVAISLDRTLTPSGWYELLCQIERSEGIRA